MIDVQSLLKEYKSPVYVYDLDEVRVAHEDLRATIPRESKLYYAAKANPHVEVIRALVELGCSVEVSSPGELAAALAAGADVEEILYTGPGKTAAEIDCALDNGVALFSIESNVDLARVAEAASVARQDVRALARINPVKDVEIAGLAMGGEATQFGIDGAVLHETFARAYSRMEICGLHVFMASGVMEGESLLALFAAVAGGLIEGAAALPEQPRVLNFGGGFGHPYGRRAGRPCFRSIAASLESLLDNTLAKIGCGAPPSIAFESGRYLVAASGRLLVTVQDVKYSRGERFVVLDAGINHLAGMPGLRRLPPAGIEVVPVDDVDTVAREQPSSFVVGPLCTPLDRWARSDALGNVCPGDVVEVSNVGAYGLTASLLAFLSRDAPIEVVVSGGAVVGASRLRISRDTVAPRSLSYALADTAVGVTARA